VLKSNLFTMRTVIDEYTYDKQKAPQTLNDLVSDGYLRQVPIDRWTKQRRFLEDIMDASNTVNQASRAYSIAEWFGEDSLEGTPYSECDVKLTASNTPCRRSPVVNGRTAAFGARESWFESMRGHNFTFELRTSFVDSIGFCQSTLASPTFGHLLKFPPLSARCVAARLRTVRVAHQRPTFTRILRFLQLTVGLLTASPERARRYVAATYKITSNIGLTCRSSPQLCR